VILRKEYLDRIMQVSDTPVVKIITGIRRSGKSFLLRQIQAELRAKGVHDSSIIYMNFESLIFEPYLQYRAFYDQVMLKAAGSKGRVYLFFDEIQDVSEWEKAIRSFMVDLDCDIYITGSNANLLSSELATFLAGRYLELHLYPLSYREFLTFSGLPVEQNVKSFQEYLQYGGFPGLHQMTKDENIRFDYIKGILNTVILKDVVQRNKIRDTDLLERVFYFIMDNIGSIISAKKIADFLKSQGRKLSAETVYGYLRALEDALVIYKARRFDIRGKRILETQEKYYLADLGFKHAVLGFRDATIPGLLENIVYLELKRRGFEVYVGKNDRFEVDFIAERKDERIYLQVAYLLSSEETIDREYRALASIPDHYPKLVLSMDPFHASSIDGVRWLNLENYLLAL
jgi:uncharacterized protein